MSQKSHVHLLTHVSMTSICWNLYLQHGYRHPSWIFPLAAIRIRLGKSTCVIFKGRWARTQIKFQNLLRISCIRGPGQGQYYWLPYSYKAYCVRLWKVVSCITANIISVQRRQNPRFFSIVNYDATYDTLSALL